MKIILAHEEEKKEEKVVISTSVSSDGGLLITGRLKGGGTGVNWSLCKITEKGLILHASIGEELGFPLDSSGKLKIRGM